MKAVGPYRSFKDGEVVKARTACCSEFIPFSYCKREFTLSKGQEYVRKRLGTSRTVTEWANPRSVQDVLESRKKRPRLLAVHEVGSGKTYLGLRVVEDALKRGTRDNPAIVIVASPDKANVQTWMKEIFSSNDKNGKDHCIRDVGTNSSSCGVPASKRRVERTSDNNCFTTPIYKHWCFMKEFNYNKPGYVHGLYKSQYDQYASSPKYNGTVYVDTHDMVFRALVGFNKVSEHWDVPAVSRAAWTNNTKTSPSLRQIIRQSTRNATIFVDEAHKCVDTEKKRVDGRLQYRYAESLALLAILMFADDSCRIVLATATPKHTSGLGGMGALGYALYTAREKASLPRVTDVEGEKGAGDSKPSNAKGNKNSDKTSIDSINTNNDNNNNETNVGNKNTRLSNSLFDKIMQADTTKLDRADLPVLSQLMAGKSLGNNAGNSGTAAFRTIESYDMRELIRVQNNRPTAIRALADVTVDVIKYYSAMFQHAGTRDFMSVLPQLEGESGNAYDAISRGCKTKGQGSVCTLLYGMYGLVSHWKTSSDSTLYPRASMTPCDVRRLGKFDFSTPCVYKLKVPVAPLHNILLKTPATHKRRVWAIQDALGKGEGMTDEQRLLAITQGKFKDHVRTISGSAPNDLTQRQRATAYRTVMSLLKDLAYVVHTEKAGYRHIKKKESVRPSVVQRKEWGITTAVRGKTTSPVAEYTVKMVSDAERQGQLRRAVNEEKGATDAHRSAANKLKAMYGKTDRKNTSGAAKAEKNAKAALDAAKQRVREATAALKAPQYVLEVSSKVSTKRKKGKPDDAPIIEVVEELEKKMERLRAQIKEGRRAKDNNAVAMATMKLEQYETDYVGVCIDFVDTVLAIKDERLDRALVKAIKVRAKTIGLDVMRMESSVASLSRAGYHATVDDRLVGQALAVYGDDSNAPVSGGRDPMPRFALFSMINLTTLNLIKQATPDTGYKRRGGKVTVVPTITRTKGDRVTPMRHQHGNMMIYVDPSARLEATLLVHTLVNQGRCILVDGRQNNDNLDGNVFAIVGCVPSKYKPSLSRMQVPTGVSILRRRGVTIEPLKKVFAFVMNNFKTEVSLMETIKDSLLANDGSYANQLTALVREWSTTPVEALLRKEGSVLGLSINKSAGRHTQESADSASVHSFHIPFVSQLLSVIAHLNSNEAVTTVTKSLNALFENEAFVQRLEDRGGVGQVHRIVGELKTRLHALKKDLFDIWRRVRAYMNAELGKYSTLFRYQSTGDKSLDSEYVLNSLYNQPENNTGDYINAVVSDVTHGKSFMNTRFAVLYHLTEKKSPLSESQKIQIYGRIDRNCSRSLDAVNVSRRIELLPVGIGGADEGKSASRGADTTSRRDASAAARSRGSSEAGGSSKGGSKGGSKGSDDNTFGLGVPGGLPKDTASMRYFASFLPWDASIARCDRDCTTKLYSFATALCDDAKSSDVLGISMKRLGGERRLMACDTKRALSVHSVDTKFYASTPESRDNRIYKTILSDAANAKHFKNYIAGTTLGEKNMAKAVADYRQKVILMRGGLLPYNKSVANRPPPLGPVANDSERVRRAIRVLSSAAKRAGKTTTELRDNLEKPAQVYQIQRGRAANAFDLTPVDAGKTSSLNARQVVQGAKRGVEPTPAKYWTRAADADGGVALTFSGSNRTPAYTIAAGRFPPAKRLKRHFDCIDQPAKKGCLQELTKLRRALAASEAGRALIRKGEGGKGFVINRNLEVEERAWLGEYEKKVPTFRAMPVSQRYRDEKDMVGILRRLGGSIGERDPMQRRYGPGVNANERRRLLSKHDFATNLEAAALIQRRVVARLRQKQMKNLREQSMRMRSKKTREDESFVRRHERQLKNRDDWAKPGVVRVDIYARGVGGMKVDVGQVGATGNTQRLLPLPEAKRLALLTGQPDVALLLSMLSRDLKRMVDGKETRLGVKTQAQLDRTTLLYDPQKLRLSRPIRGTPQRTKGWEYMAAQFDMDAHKYLKRRMHAQ